jgi:hypothetical protein
MPRFVLDEKRQEKRDLLSALGYDPDKVPDHTEFVICEQDGSKPWLEVSLRGDTNRFPIAKLDDQQREAFHALFDSWTIRDNELWVQP